MKNNFNIWLNSRANELEWIYFKNYKYNFKNKYIKIISQKNNELPLSKMNNIEIYGKITEQVDEEHFWVLYNGDYKLLNLSKLNCLIDKGTITYREFCIINGYKFINYIKKSHMFDLKISEKEFIQNFSYLIYENSGW
jgi:hypothetical protein